MMNYQVILVNQFLAKKFKKSNQKMKKNNNNNLNNLNNNKFYNN